jgi:hypothetical protein
MIQIRSEHSVPLVRQKRRDGHGEAGWKLIALDQFIFVFLRKRTIGDKIDIVVAKLSKVKIRSGIFTIL